MIPQRLDRRLLIASLALAAVFSAAFAAGAFYLGRWKIVSAVVAPWSPERNPDSTEMRGLVGKTLAITPKAILGPRQVACTGPRYRLKDYPADMLFEGAFGEMHQRNPSADPAKIAASVGFRGRSWKTLETGCEVEIEYHFIDPNTAAFGLNDHIYTLKKQP